MPLSFSLGRKRIFIHLFLYFSEEKADRQNLFSAIEEISKSKKTGTPHRQALAFELLFMNLCIQFFIEAAEAASASRDSLECYKKVSKPTGKKDDTDPIAVLVDVLLR